MQFVENTGLQVAKVLIDPKSGKFPKVLLILVKSRFPFIKIQLQLISNL